MREHIGVELQNWVNLHNHTVFSMLDGHGQVDEYAKRAAELGMKALSITDHGNLHGWIDFYDAAKQYGIKPILGIEAYQARKTRFDQDEEELAGGATDQFEQRGPYHLTVLAKNDVGYHNLIKLSSRSFIEGFYGKPRIDHELLSEHSDGIVVLSGCLNGEVVQALMRHDYDTALAHAGTMQDIVGKENYFIEVMNHTIDEEIYVLPQLEKIAKQIGARIVPTGDCHYVRKEESRAHDMMLCVATGSKVHEKERFQFVPDEFYLRSYQEMRDRFPDEWLSNSLDVADMIDVEISRGNLYFPEFPIPTEEEPYEYFERLVWEGIEERYGASPDTEVIDRTQHELRTVKRLGFPPYFLVVSDLVRWAKDSGIRVGYGRGSAAGSIISYALNITNLDPLRFGLVFERFLLPEEAEYYPHFQEIA